MQKTIPSYQTVPTISTQKQRQGGNLVVLLKISHRECLLLVIIQQQNKMFLFKQVRVVFAYQASRRLETCPGLSGQQRGAYVLASAGLVPLWQHSKAPQLSAPRCGLSAHQAPAWRGVRCRPQWQSAAPECHRTPAWYRSVL